MILVLMSHQSAASQKPISMDFKKKVFACILEKPTQSKPLKSEYYHLSSQLMKIELC